MPRLLGPRVGPLACALVFAVVVGCGETVGEPIIAAGNGDGLSTDPLPPSSDTELATGPVLGLCDSCETSTSGQCGDGNDYCVRYRTGEFFCARDCSESGGCPSGYHCVDLSNSSVRQCAPLSTTCDHRNDIPQAPNLGTLRTFLFDEINRARLRVGVPALASDECLQEIAQTSTRELALSGTYGVKYARECEPVLPECACGWAAEYQTKVTEYALVWDRALTLGVEQGLSSTNTDGESSLTSSAFGRIGIGVLMGGDEAWISFAFGE